METEQKNRKHSNLEGIVEAVITIAAGLGGGYVAQRYRQELGEFPLGLQTAVIAANVAKSGIRDTYHWLQGESANQIVAGDIVNGIVFNISGVVGYFAGVLQDIYH